VRHRHQLAPAGGHEVEEFEISEAHRSRLIAQPVE
jgi:hypothetical protein